MTDSGELVEGDRERKNSLTDQINTNTEVVFK